MCFLPGLPNHSVSSLSYRRHCMRRVSEEHPLILGRDYYQYAAKRITSFGDGRAKLHSKNEVGSLSKIAVTVRKLT
jgi:hypothetical protein